MEAVLGVDDMRAAEARAIAEGVSEWELMQRAGEGAASWVVRASAGRPVTVLCGPGNNGGDGYVIAESLRRRGQEVRVIAPMPPRTETAQRAAASFSGEISMVGELRDPVTVDSLFGYGLERKVAGAYATLLEQLATSHCYKIAIDVPSTVHSDTGLALGPLPRYDLTLALGAWKLAHFLMPAKAFMGMARLVPIGLGFPPDSPQLSRRPLLSAPTPDSHKYRRGLLAVVAGKMPGAPQLSATAAMRAGAGYVKLLTEQYCPHVPPDLVVEIGDLSDSLSDERIDALLLGPGLGRDEEARGRLAAVLETGKPCVLDADALHLLDPDAMEGHDATKLCLTPHDGELARLCKAFGVTAESKLGRVRALHDVTALTVLAKGPDTILASGGALRFFRTGSSWLSIAGTGDVLAGIVASRLATHGDAQRACEEGVWVHQEAARVSGPAFSAGDLAHAVKNAVASLL